MEKYQLLDEDGAGGFGRVWKAVNKHSGSNQRKRRQFILCVRIHGMRSSPGLHYMHRKGYFHRDLKPKNLLVSRGLIKIGDMGSAKEINSNQPLTDCVTTHWYRAPEVVLG
ncbi:hypothetical protein Q3G72_016996 [Acer saccharum]|nr:hypothetical protein Q3G72_016996 [Acer saccharum]